jgi:putative transposase
LSEEELRREAVRRRLAGESPDQIASALGRTDRWVRKWVARHAEDGHADRWAQERSRAPRNSPTRTPDELRDQILAARERLVANPRAKYGSLAIQWELRRLGVDPIPPSRTIERVLARAGLSRPRRRSPRYVSRGVPYPAPVGVEPGTTHQVDLVGPRHLLGGVEFHALNLIDVGSHEAANDILDVCRPPLLARSLVGIWSNVGVPAVAQFDNHANFRGGIQPASEYFGPVVATCLDLGVTPRFIPLREPWRNGVVEHFNDVWDKSFFRTEVFGGIDHLRTENRAFVAFHNTHHRYAAHGGASPSEVMAGRLRNPLSASYEPPTRLPAQGRIEVVRYVRSNRRVDLFGKRITVAEDQTHQYVTAIIKVRARKVLVVTLDGEIIHHGDYAISRVLR